MQGTALGTCCSSVLTGIQGFYTSSWVFFLFLLHILEGFTESVGLQRPIGLVFVYLQIYDVPGHSDCCWEEEAAGANKPSREKYDVLKVFVLFFETFET